VQTAAARCRPEPQERGRSATATGTALSPTFPRLGRSRLPGPQARPSEPPTQTVPSRNPHPACGSIAPETPPEFARLTLGATARIATIEVCIDRSCRSNDEIPESPGACCNSWAASVRDCVAIRATATPNARTRAIRVYPMSDEFATRNRPRSRSIRTLRTGLKPPGAALTIC
jgi:hypothetical protein